MKKTKLKLLKCQNYLAMVGNSAGTKLFRNIYVSENAKKRDILKNGENSCAYFVSSILKIFDLISLPHATVKSTIDDMLKNGWRPTKKLLPGNVILWEEIESDDGSHQHLGFYISGDKTISNSHKKRIPKIHHLTYGNNKKGEPNRKVIRIFTHRMISK